MAQKESHFFWRLLYLGESSHESERRSTPAGTACLDVGRTLLQGDEDPQEGGARLAEGSAVQGHVTSEGNDKEKRGRSEVSHQVPCEEAAGIPTAAHRHRQSGEPQGICSIEEVKQALLKDGKGFYQEARDLHRTSGCMDDEVVPSSSFTSADHRRDTKMMGHNFLAAQEQGLVHFRALKRKASESSSSAPSCKRSALLKALRSNRADGRHLNQEVILSGAAEVQAPAMLQRQVEKEVHALATNAPT